MRKPVILLVLLSGCWLVEGHPPHDDDQHDHDDPPKPDDDDDDGGCTFLCPIPFEFSAASPFGAGTAYDVGFNKDEDVSVTITSSDPSIFEVVTVDFTKERVYLKGRAPGNANLVARDAVTDKVLHIAGVSVEYVATIELQFRAGPGLDAPVTSLAALIDTEESLGLYYRSSTGAKLRGRGPITTRGSVLPSTFSEFRGSDAFGAYERAGIYIAGAGAIVATLEGDPREFAFPIDIVSAPATTSLVAMQISNNTLVAHSSIAVGNLVGIDVIGKTADNRYVAGVTATWSKPPGLKALFGTTQASTEAVYQGEAPGTYDVTATVSGQTLTQQIVVTP
jgi:hypothetical protein